MRYIKTYEELNNGPKLGDYVICFNPYYSMEWNNYLMSKIGQIVYINNDKNGKEFFTVKFDEPIKLPNAVWDDERRCFWRSEIKHWSKNRKDLEQYADLYDNINIYNI